MEAMKYLITIITALIMSGRVSADATRSDLINEYRVGRGLTELREDFRLCALANVRVEQVKTDWSHNGFVNPWNYCWNCRKMGEILAKGFTEPKNEIKAWDSSPTHKEVMADPSYNSFCVLNSDNYTVVIFGENK